MVISRRDTAIRRRSDRSQQARQGLLLHAQHPRHHCLAHRQADAPSARAFRAGERAEVGRKALRRALQHPGLDALEQPQDFRRQAVEQVARERRVALQEQADRVDRDRKHLGVAHGDGVEGRRHRAQRGRLAEGLACRHQPEHPLVSRPRRDRELERAGRERAQARQRSSAADQRVAAAQRHQPCRARRRADAPLAHAAKERERAGDPGAGILAH